MDEVILVDKDDNEIGRAEKISAHQEGLLHRAFSIFIFNTKGELLIQQRAPHKYHSANLWSNTCCSHPKPDELLEKAVKRRLMEELNMEADLSWSFSFLYKAEFDNGLIEHELDHVFIGTSDEVATINPDEVIDLKYISITDLLDDIELRPDCYSFWFKEIINEVIEKKSL